MASTTRARLGTLPRTVTNFAVFIDTHRDQPHVPTFEDDIHRGWTKPTPVVYIPPAAGAPADDWGLIIRVADGEVIAVHEKHKFVTLDWWRDFVTTWVTTHGSSPIETSGELAGMMPTSRLRDARRKVYHLKSLRQIVRAHQVKGA